MVTKAVSARMRAAAGSGRHAREPAYLVIANTIADRIGSGEYRPGDQLPTEPQLRAEFGVSPMTVRRAISILLDRGLVAATQGKGPSCGPPILGKQPSGYRRSQTRGWVTTPWKCSCWKRASSPSTSEWRPGWSVPL